MEKAARLLFNATGTAVLIKGGHLTDDATDLLYDGAQTTLFPSARIHNPNTHGTGCTLSSAIACRLAEGDVYKRQPESRERNFTNEGGYEYRFRYLKNIMGLWMIQSVRHELGDKYSFAQLCDMAEAESDFPSRVDVNDDAFWRPTI